MNASQPPRGTRDLLPQTAAVFQRIEEEFAILCRDFGYLEVRTPILEYEAVFTRSIGEGSEIVQKQMFRFASRSGKELVLRPEGTAACVRAYIAAHLWQEEKVTKWFYRGPMFRYERPQKGRERQFYQCGLECFGSDHPVLDAELIELGWHFLSAVYDASFTLLVNSVGCRTCRPAYEVKLKEALQSLLDVLCPDCQTRYKTVPLRVFDCKNKSCQRLVKELPLPVDSLCPACQAHRHQLLTVLAESQIPYREEPHLVRGLDYYTRTTFEMVNEEGLTLLGGGRYDALVAEMGGADTPAAGWAAGTDRIALAAIAEDLKCNIWILPLKKQYFAEGMQLARYLRQQGLSCSLNLEERKIKARVKEAITKARFGIFLGEDEVDQKMVALKDFSTGTQKTLSWAEAAATVQKKMGAENHR